MESPTRILLVQLRQLGDVVLTSALLEDLRAAHPAARIDLLTGARPAELVRGNPFVSEILLYEREHAWQMIRAIRRRRYDWVIDVQSSPRTAPLVLLSGARRRVGWRIRGPWRYAYTHRVPRHAIPPVYMVRQRQRLLEVLGVAPGARRARLHLDERERQRGEAALRSLATPADAPHVGLVLSAGTPSTMWPVERFAELATQLAAAGAVPVVFATRGDIALVDRCLALAPDAVGLRVPELRPFAATIAALDVLVSADTGPAHIAMALDVPTVTLYGPTEPEVWNPGLPTTLAIRSPRRTCPACARRKARTADDHTCMREIGTAEVLDRVRALLHAHRDAGRD